MARHLIKKAASSHTADYPSLKEHLASRRRFLEVAGVSIATSGLLAACGRSLARESPDSGVRGDATTEHQPDADVNILGAVENPDYFMIRIPSAGDLSAYLSDGGYCQFYVEAATYNSESNNALVQNLSTAQDRCRDTISDFTYDGLNTSQGLAGAEDDLLEALDALVQELGNHSNPTLEAVTLTISYLEPEAQLDGGIGMPGYPE